MINIVISIVQAPVDFTCVQISPFARLIIQWLIFVMAQIGRL